MTEEDLRTIERELAIALPPIYREAALANSFSDLIHHEPIPIIFCNRSHRSGENGDKDWPNTRFCFGSDAFGDCLCIDLTKPELPVLLRDHETSEIFTERESFAAWLDLYRRTGETCLAEFENVVPQQSGIAYGLRQLLLQSLPWIAVLLMLFGAVWSGVHNSVVSPARAKSCLSNLWNIDSAKEQVALRRRLSIGTILNEADIVDLNDTHLLRVMPTCPNGASYILNPVGTDPVCTSGRKGHSLAEFEAQFDKIEETSE